MPTSKRPPATADPPTGASADKEQDSVYYSRWFNEDSLINQRLTWLLLAQALLFAAYGTVATKAVDSCDEKASYLFSVLSLISRVGPAFALVIFVGIGAAIVAQALLHHRRLKHWRNIGVSTPTTAIGWLTGLSVPCIFFLAWQTIPVPDMKKVAAACKLAEAPASVGTAAGAAGPVASAAKGTVGP